MTFTFDYSDLLDKIYEEQKRLKNKHLTDGRTELYGKYMAYDFIVDYCENHFVDKPRVLFNRIKEKLTEMENYNKFNPSLVHEGYINALKDIKQKLNPIVKIFEMKGYKTTTYNKKSHENNITQLENSVRKMF